jgi:hypothetical protein
LQKKFAAEQALGGGRVDPGGDPQRGAMLGRASPFIGGDEGAWHVFRGRGWRHWHTTSLFTLACRLLVPTSAGSIGSALISVLISPSLTHSWAIKAGDFFEKSISFTEVGVRSVYANVDLPT